MPWSASKSLKDESEPLHTQKTAIKQYKTRCFTPHSSLLNMENFLEIARCCSCKPQNLRGEDAGVIDGEVDDLVPGVLLEHQLHLGKLDAPNLSSCCEADRLLGGLHTRLLP